MKKKKIDVAQDSPFIANWVETNEDKLGELQQANPDLFTAVQSALNYLNNYLGGSAPIKIEPKAPVQPTVSVAISEPLKPYALPFYQWRLKTLQEVSINSMLLFDNFISQFEKVQGQPLVALTNDFEGIQKVTIYKNPTSKIHGFKDVGLGLERSDLTLDPISDLVYDTASLEYISELVTYCNDNISDKFNYLFNNDDEFQNVTERWAEYRRGEGWFSLSDADLFYLYNLSPIGFLLYQCIRVFKRRQDFEDYQFIDEFGTVYTTKTFTYNASEKEITLKFLGLNGWQKSEEITLSLLSATKAFLGLSFIASSVINNTDVKIRFQAVKLKNYRPLPFIIGDRVVLVQNDGMDANIGAEALVKRVDLYESSFKDDDKPNGLITNLEVAWQDNKSKRQSDGGYPIQVFKNLSRPQAINSVPTAPTEEQTVAQKVWRVKTESEFLDKFGTDWRNVVNWTRDKDFLFGKPLIDIVQDTDIARIPKTDASYLGSAGSRSDALYTKSGLDPTDKSRSFGLDADDVTDAPLPIITPQGNKVFDVMRKEAYKFRAKNPEESWAFQEYVFSKGVERLKNIGDPKQIIDDEASDFMVENGILLTLSLYSFNSSTVEEVSLSTLGIKVGDYPKPAPAKKATKKPTTPKVQATPPSPKSDVQNLYNELDDLEI
jgi:hypothetical protein